MNEGLVGILILSAFIVLLTVVFYYMRLRLWASSVIAGLVSVSLLHVVSYLVQGYLDAFFLMSLLVGGVVSTLISYFIGYTLRRVLGSGGADNS